MAFEGFPHLVGWELTLACNLRCRHCASSAGAVRTRELTLPEALAICEQFPELLVREVIFTGGEPFLNPGWAAIAAKLQDCNIKTGIVTNGLAITGDLIRQMKESGLKSAGISIDGPEAVHDGIRSVSGAFQKTVSGARHLAEAGIDLTVITSVTALNVTSLDQMFELVRSLGAWKWQLQPLFPTGRGQTHGDLHLSYDQFLQLGNFIREHGAIDPKHSLRIVPADSCGYFSELDLPEYGWRGCTAGLSSVGIMSDGRVKGCLSWPDWTAEGDLRHDDLWTIWFRESSFAHLRTFNPNQVEGVCQGCDCLAECAGGCEAMSLATTGKWHSDPYCYRRLLQLTQSDRSLPDEVCRQLDDRIAASGRT